MNADKNERLRAQFEQKFWQDTRSEILAKRHDLDFPPDRFDAFLKAMHNGALAAWFYAANHLDDIHGEALGD